MQNEILGSKPLNYFLSFSISSFVRVDAQYSVKGHTFLGIEENA